MLSMSKDQRVWILSTDYFTTFFHMLNVAIFQALLLSKYIDSAYLVCATPPTILC